MVSLIADSIERNRKLFWGYICKGWTNQPCFATALFLKNSLAQTSTISAKGYIMVKIIQMSIILMYDVVGRLWLMPMKLAGKINLCQFTAGKCHSVSSFNSTHSTCLQAGQCYSVCSSYESFSQLSSTYKVARTSITVRLTWTTMVRNWSVNMLISWLRNISIPVGRVTWWNSVWKI